METAKGSNIQKIGEYCFWAALVTEIAVVIVDKSAYTNPLESQLFRLTFLLFCAKVLCTKYSAKEWMCILLFGALMCVSYLVNGRDEAVRVVALIAACKGMDVKKVMKTVFFVTAAGCLALVLLSVTGIYGTISMTADFGRGGRGEQLFETRYTLGMGHPNALHCMMWLVIMLAAYCYRDVLRWHHFAAFAILDFVLFFLTDSKTAFIVWLMSVILIVVMKYGRQCREGKYVYFMGAAVILGCVAFSMMGAHVENTYFTPDSLMHRLDRMLNGRYQSVYAVEAARLENWKLFAAPGNAEYFDAGFVRLFYWYGIIPGILYISMNLYLVYKSWREKDYVLFVVPVVFSVFNLMEAHFISEYLLRNYLFVLTGCYWCLPPCRREVDI